MRTVIIRNLASKGSSGAEVMSSKVTYPVYFCRMGLLAVLGASHFNEAKVSLTPISDSLEVEVVGQLFKSKLGEYNACPDHPALVHELMGKEHDGKDFTFYIKTY